LRASGRQKENDHDSPDPCAPPGPGRRSAPAQTGRGEPERSKQTTNRGHEAKARRGVGDESNRGGVRSASTG
jgi:hypothetical protein